MKNFRDFDYENFNNQIKTFKDKNMINIEELKELLQNFEEFCWLVAFLRKYIFF